MNSRFILINLMFAGLMLAGVMLSACTMGPDYQQPALDINTPETFENVSDREAVAYKELNSWWQVFDDPEIDRIVINVLQNNPDIRLAAARVLEVQSVFSQTRADQYPTLSLNVEAGRQSQGGINPLTGSGDTQIYDIYSLSLPASFELDLWGRLARSTESARAQLLSAEENRRTVIQTLVAESVDLYLNIESLERRIQVNHKSIDAYRKSLELVEGRYRRGLASILDVRQASRTLAQAESLPPPLTAALGTSRQSLAVLQGQYPTSTRLREQPADYFKLPPPVPSGLPSELLNRRPDIKTAEASLHSASARIGVAKASRFPRISLTAAFGYSSGELGDLFDPKSELWNIAAGASQSLFDAGKLAAGQRAAEARYLQAESTYAKTVLQAFFEVESALLTRKEKIEQRHRLVKYLDEAAATLDVAEDRYKRGLVDYLTVLDAQQVRHVAEQQLVGVEYELLSNHVSLCRALGGGWDLKIAEAN